MSKEGWFGVVLGVVVAGLVIAWLYTRRAEAPPAAQAPPPAAAPVAPAEPVADAPPPIEHPLPDPERLEDQPALPPLGESDPPVREALVGLLGREPVESFLVPRELLRNAVATLNSLTGDAVPLRARFVQNIPGLFEVQRAGDGYVLDPRNAERYARFMALVDRVDAEQAVALYRRYYPLLQKAYAELGYPQRYFNDRVVEVIDHLLAAPSPPSPLRLVRPKVLYEFADPALEERSSGHKLMMRIGAANADRIKHKLRAIRARIAQPPGAPVPDAESP